MKIISKEQAVELIKKTNGQIFSAEFIKKSTGRYKKLHCRLGVKKGVSGEGMKFDPFSKGLIPVYDLDQAGHDESDKHFRMINLNTLLGLVIGKKTFVVYG